MFLLYFHTLVFIQMLIKPISIISLPILVLKWFHHFVFVVKYNKYLNYNFFLRNISGVFFGKLLIYFLTRFNSVGLLYYTIKIHKRFFFLIKTY